jgi:DNA polymerase elongation subunit (family B)
VQYNISPDTILHRSTFHNITPYDVINQTEKFQLAISDAISKNATLCANGSMYSKEKEGFLPHLVKKYFADRVAAKNEMKKWAKEAERVKLEIERRKAC